MRAICVGSTATHCKFSLGAPRNTANSGPSNVARPSRQASADCASSVIIPAGPDGPRAGALSNRAGRRKSQASDVPGPICSKKSETQPAPASALPEAERQHCQLRSVERRQATQFAPKDGRRPHTDPDRARTCGEIRKRPPKVPQHASLNVAVSCPGGGTCRSFE